MGQRLKQYVCSRVLEVLNWKSKPNDILPAILSSNLTLGKLQNTHTEFYLPLTPLQHELNVEANLSDAKNIPPDNVICNVYETTIKKDINIVFQINKNIFIKDILQEVSSDPVLWKKSLLENHLSHSPKKKVIVEYSSPNIAKPFHMGHLRSTIIGNFIANIHEFLSHDVVRINYLGDWGTQFGLLQVGLDLCEYSEAMIKQNPMQALYKAYVEANKKAESDPAIAARARESFQSLEEGNTEILKKWEVFRNYTVQELQTVYQRLGVYFDEYNWESMYSAKEISDLLQSLENRGLLKTDSDGKKVVEINQERRIPIIKSDGSTLYLTRDIAAAVDRYRKHNFTEMLYIVDNAQTDHFTALFGVLSQMQLPWAPSLKHIKFGRIRGMSTRRGSVVFLKDILDETRDIMSTKQQETHTTKVHLNEDTEGTTDILGISAVIINDLKQRRQRDYEFDWNRALQVQGDTGVKLQYTHCRLVSLERNCGVSLPGECDPSVLQEPEAVLLVKNIARFEEVIMKSYSELEACVLVNYLLRFCNLINRALEVLQVKNEDIHIGSQRLLLFHSSRVVLNEGMKIVGLQPLSQM
ncbi:probable arginine--tRNA ligase, mitochondrial isoform X2 [Periplaneta americana]|uniref:probable arginine--tRNA ligase, mitochondrial isoform X2 n=1 Tax=Periplaneta americana TaxID=6978 RepID=UPI0037E8F8C6